MMISKRHGELIRLLEKEGMIAVSDLAERFDVSLETIRRDLKPLTDSGRVVKFHGGVALAGEISEAPYQKRMRENADAKKIIGRLFARSIRDGDSLMLDTGTTTSFVARELVRHRQLTIVTNSSDIARLLAPINGNRVYLAGGEMRSDSGATLGASVVSFMERFSVLHAVVSAGAISVEAGVTDFDMEEAEVARAILARGERRIVVCDQTKFQKRGLVQVCALSGFTELVTDALPTTVLLTALQSSGVIVNAAN